MARVTRSPNYPAIPLEEAIGRVRAVYEKERWHPAEKEVIAEALGYSSLNGASTSVISALTKYGLLEPVGDRLKLSKVALDILVHEKGDPEYRAAIRRAALTPNLFIELQAEYEDRLPSDANLKTYLVKRGFNPGTVGGVIRSYRDTMEFVERETETSAASRVGTQEPEAPMQEYQSRDNGTPLPGNAPLPVATAPLVEAGPQDKVLVFQIAEDCEARTVFKGRVTQEAIDIFVALLTASKVAFPKRDAPTPTQAEPLPS